MRKTVWLRVIMLFVQENNAPPGAWHLSSSRLSPHPKERGREQAGAHRCLRAGPELRWTLVPLEEEGPSLLLPGVRSLPEILSAVPTRLHRRQAQERGVCPSREHEPAERGVRRGAASGWP